MIIHMLCCMHVLGEFSILERQILGLGLEYAVIN
jgi:hypothetical protein